MRWWGRITRGRGAEGAGEEERLLGNTQREEGEGEGEGKEQSILNMLSRALKVGYERWETIGISYLGGFIARYILSSPHHRNNYQR